MSAYLRTETAFSDKNCDLETKHSDVSNEISDGVPILQQEVSASSSSLLLPQTTSIEEIFNVEVGDKHFLRISVIRATRGIGQSGL